MLFEIYLVKISFHFIITHTHHRFLGFCQRRLRHIRAVLGQWVLGLPGSWVLGLGFPVACWLIKPTNLRASDALALVFLSLSLSFCVAVWASFFNFFLCVFFNSQQFPIVSYFIDINFHVSIFYVYLMCCQNDFGARRSLTKLSLNLMICG